MNKLFKKLADEAFFDEASSITSDIMYKFSDHKMQKFAELIVRECCQYLDNEAERLYTLSGSEEDPTYQSNFEICAEKCYDNSQGLKDYFGVEE